LQYEKRVPVEDCQVLLGRRELVHRDRHEVLVHVDIRVLVEVVADPRAVREQVLDGHVVADERKLVSEKRARRRGELEHSVVDEAHDREGRQPLRTAREREPRVWRVRDPVTTMRVAVRLLDLGPPPAVHSHDTREAGLGGDCVELVLEAFHEPEGSAC
jgi:hypothetical protein